MNQEIFENFLKDLEGYKVKFKELHWNALTLNSHKLADSISDSLKEFQDSIAEDGFSMNGKFVNNAFFPNKIESSTIKETLIMLTSTVIDFRKENNILPQEIGLNGILSVCDAYIHDLNKFLYLVDLQ